MKVQKSNVEDCQIFLTIELNAEEVEKQKEESYKKLVKTVKVPGFREGKAPRDVLENHLGKDGLLEDAIESLIPKSYSDALQEQNIKTIGEPSIQVISTQPLVYEAKAPLPPKVELGDYSKIKGKPEKVTIKKEDIDQVIEQLREQHATCEPVERPIKEMDVVVMDTSATVEGETVIDEKGVEYQIVAGLSFPAPGFPEAMVGMVKGEEKELKLKLSKNFYKREFAEKEASFRVKIIDVREAQLPKADADFAKKVLPGIEDFEALKKRIKTDMQNNAEVNARLSFENSLIDQLVKMSKIEFPPFMADMEVQQLVAQHMEQLKRSCRSEDEYKKILEKMPREELEEKYRPVAAQQVAGKMAMEELAKVEKIEADDKEISAEIERMTANAGEQMGEQRKVLSSPGYKEPIRQMLIARKTLQWLSQSARGAAKKTKTEIKKKPAVKKEAK